MTQNLKLVKLKNQISKIDTLLMPKEISLLKEIFIKKEILIFIILLTRIEKEINFIQMKTKEKIYLNLKVMTNTLKV